MVHFLILAGGKGERANSKKFPHPKQYQEVKKISPIRYLLKLLNEIDEIKTITTVISKEDILLYKENSQNIKKLRKRVIGGKTRQESSLKGIKNINKEYGNKKNQKIIIHDAARPFISKKIIKDCIKNIKKNQAVCPILKVDDTIKKLSKDNKIADEDRDKIIALQTPQGFNLKDLVSLHKNTKKNYTDDISLALESDMKVRFIPGSKKNFKITSSNDLDIFGDIANGEKVSLVGTGFDIHKFTKGNKITLGGVIFKSKYGLLANSDGDVLFHAITDSIFGAFKSGDIGLHFPPSNKSFKNKNSLHFLNKSVDILKENSGSIINLDLNLICDYPKIRPIRKKILKNISNSMNLDINKISLKASSTEDQGFINSSNGIAAQAIISIEVPRNEK